MATRIKWFSVEIEHDYDRDPDNFTVVNDKVFHYTGKCVGQTSFQATNAMVKEMYPK